MARVTKEMTMGELLQTYYEQCPEIVDVLTGLGMHCIGCPSSIGELSLIHISEPTRP